MKAEDKVLAVLDKPLTNIEIKRITGLKANDVSKTFQILRDKGQIYSRGHTSAWRYMRLATAIEEIFKKLSELGIRLDNVEKDMKLR